VPTNLEAVQVAGPAWLTTEQLGLKLESGKTLFDMVVVDYVEKVPVVGS
jgi:hypothetical protein